MIHKLSLQLLSKSNLLQLQVTDKSNL